MRTAANVTVIAIGTSFFAGCLSNDVSVPLDPTVFAYDKTYIGKKYRSPVNVQILCPKPDFQINQPNDCVIATDDGATTVVDVAATRGNVFFKLRLSDGREGYVTESELLLLEQFSRPSPEIGMSESAASDTNWGIPEKKNITEIAGHRSEQWVFPSSGYLYIEDGVLRTIQRND